MQPPWQPQPAAQNEGKAVAAIVLGGLSFFGSTCWLGLPLGIPAIVLGALALRDIRRSQGTLGGTGMAISGIVLGSLGTLVFVATVAVMVATLSGAGAFGHHGPHRPPPSPPATTQATPPSAPPNETPATPVHVVAVHPTRTEPLPALLRAQVQEARAASESVLLETVGPSCAACGEIDATLGDASVQRALAGVRIVRVDVAEAGPQASALRVATPGLPWFYLLDAQGSPRDGVSADEWDDNEADEIAPVLGAFVRGDLEARKVPWRGARAL